MFESVPEKRRHAQSDGQRILLRNLGWVSKQNIAHMKELTYKAKRHAELFDDARLILVDFKLEFGLYKGEVVPGDEFSRTAAAACGTKKHWRKWTKTISARASVA
ncbi:phosphoribosylaminoimidazolesuccinocarboxamide synthase [Escherichia coli]